MMIDKVQSVSQVVLAIKKSLELSFKDLVLEGEVSNISKTVAGHYYFTLSDEQSQISCAFFKMNALRNSLIRKLKDGDKILVIGDLSVYNKRGVFQIIVKRISPKGQGSLKLQYDILKEKLSRKGFFDLEYKKEIPVYPKKIALITAPHGAALQDFLNIMKRRSIWYNVVIVPAIVQGDESSKSLIAALERAQVIKDVDVIVLTRGGGAIEDLWSFNDEVLVEKIFKCPIPIVSAVGHQVDYTLSDLVSDLRAETPSAAAERLSQPQTLLKKDLNVLGTRLKISLLEMQNLMKKKLSRINPQNLLTILKSNYRQFLLKLDHLQFLNRIESLTQIDNFKIRLDDAHESLLQSMQRNLMDQKKKLIVFDQLLNSFNPNQVLKRGYSYVKIQNKVISSISQMDSFSEDQELKIHFYDGNISVKKVK